jgi:hypothetical protein
MATYVSRHAARQTEPELSEYEEAVSILDRHVTSGGMGRCAECGLYSPCPERQEGLVIMNRYMRWLPIEAPGTTEPRMIGARRVA